MHLTHRKKKTLFIAQMAMLLAIEAIVCFTPLGSLPIGPLVATLSHIPVIVTAILLGTVPGMIMGFAFGLFSFLVWTFMPASPLAFVFTPFYSFGEISGNFWSLIICFVPRILIGLVTGLTFKLFQKAFARFEKIQVLSYTLAGILGSLTNTLLVLGGIYAFFGRPYAEVLDVSYDLLLGLIGTSIATNGVLEAVLGGVVAFAVCKPLRKRLARMNAAKLS